jgi:hypothetical protein
MGARLLPTRKRFTGKTTAANSGGKPKPAKAFLVAPTNSRRWTTTAGMPSFSILAADRPQAVAQEPQLAFPIRTAWAPARATSSAAFAVSIPSLPVGNSV